MPLTETLNFVVGSFLFVRSLFEAIFDSNDERDRKADLRAKVRGRGLGQPLPDQLPTIVDIKNAIPRHCFKSVVSLSLYYAVKDCVQVSMFLWEAVLIFIASKVLTWF